VPLVLAREPWAAGKKIIVLEPRRLAARAAAVRMAATLSETVGATVGYRVRFGSKVSKQTRIEVVTEGVFTRMVLDDASLEGVAALLFDEFHERSLDADLGLALARDVQTGLREDLRLVVMSATIDGARVAALLGDASVIESHGRAYPVETRYRGRDPRLPIERAVADAVMEAMRAEQGSVLAFLPGAGEIRRAETLLRERISDRPIDVVALYGALEADVQDRAIAPAPQGGARSCWRRRSRRPRSPSRACASWSTAGLRACRATSRMWADRLETVRCRARLPISAAAAPAVPSPACATGCGTSRRPTRSRTANVPEILAA
jgi:ATP-dependent helicase HrpB